MVFLGKTEGYFLLEGVDVVYTFLVGFSFASEFVDFHLHGFVIDFQFLHELFVLLALLEQLVVLFAGQ
jgi:hypothetical protein